jgi:signal transduction histidine kinase
MSGRHPVSAEPRAKQPLDHNEAGEAAAALFRPARSFAPEQPRTRVNSDAYSTRLRAESLPIDLFRLDTAGNILSHHGHMGRSDGSRLPAQQLLGRNCLEICDEIEAAGNPHVAAFANRLRHLLSGRSHEFWCVCIHAERTLQLNVISVGGAEPVLVIVQDISELLQLEEALCDATRSLARIREEERRSVAADLHDTTCQHLVAIGFGLSALERGGAEPATVADMRGALSDVFKEIRTLSYLLYPPGLASEGLVISLKDLVRGYRRRAGVAANLSVRGQLDALPLEVEQAVLHIVQEALINAHRHANATKIQVSVTLSRRGLTIRVIDDGPAGALKDFTPGVGVRSMGARAAQLGGRLFVGAGRSGAIVSAFFPASSLWAQPSVGSGHAALR